MEKIQTGDIVRYLNAVGGGRVVKVVGNMAYVDDDGFETPVLISECVVVSRPGLSGATPADSRQYDVTTGTRTTTPSPDVKPAPTQTTPVEDTTSDLDTSETPYGDTLNIILGYEAVDITHIGDSGYEVSLVNDSNYYLYFTYATRGDDDSLWTARYAGIIEPNIQLHIGDLNRSDVSGLDKIAVQIIAFKRDKAYAVKEPVNIIRSLDTTKFFKVHCFKDNEYFDKRVLAIDLVRDDKAVGGDTVNPTLVDMLAAKMTTPLSDKRPSPKASKTGRRSTTDEPLVVDLHINELLDTTAGMSNSDILNYQIDVFRKTMDANLKKLGNKIIFIHGKGDGILRQALLKELNYRYKGVETCDASFAQYGYGATQVTIRRLQQHRT